LADVMTGPRPGGALEARVEGGYLAFNKNAELPDICVKCGARQGIVRRSQPFSYTLPWVFALLVFCNIGGLIAMLVTMKRVKVNLPLCTTCNARWRNAHRAVLAASLLLIAPLALFFLPVDSRDVGALVMWLMGLGVIVFIAVTAGFARSRLLRARSIDDTTIKLSGVDPGAAIAIAHSS
jgi:hypothetical protein